MDKQKKNKNSFIKILPMLLIAIFCFVFLFSAYKILTTMQENKKSEEAYQDLRDQLTDDLGNEDINGKDSAGDESDDQDSDDYENGRKPAKATVDIKALQKKYPELQAWIKAEGVGIDYPVMQADNNEYYLTRLYDGTQNPNGSLFMDIRNVGLFKNDNTVIYGHNMDNGAMFGNLDKYKSQDFYEENPTMTITTEDGDYEIELISGTVEDGDYQFVEFDFDDFDDMKAYVSELQSRSTFKSKMKLEEGDKLISLCTCTYESQNARFMVVGKW